MPYRFSFDLSHISESFFSELAKIAYAKSMHRRIGRDVQHLCEKFKISELTSLDVSDALTIVKDLMNVYVRNIVDREKFLKTEKRALFLPHCSRKYMDGRCQSHFDPDVPSYYCARCSPDCLINKATMLGKENGYDVYVLPGGTCIHQILTKNPYEGVVGVACSQELKEVEEILKRRNLPCQMVFLIKNGCANTTFNLESLNSMEIWMKRLLDTKCK